ncbi:uncharacterized protein RJT21DRAFT_58999 [Scheffersomyces amazonensis]|uniref:uncharacterized protein n=1 Tax=Scheffersomyces amazonensis TaxID=1078765 RepID=UPI00315C666E
MVKTESTNSSGIEDYFPKLLPDLFNVYQSADKETQILNTVELPKDFYEGDASLIISSYHEYLKNHKSIKYTSIIEKFNNNDPDYITSPYRLYHDIKIISAIKISKYSLGTKPYNDIDFFYKFTTELLLRELSKYNFELDQPTEYHKSELESQLSEDFSKILTTYNLNNGEIITYISKTEEPEPQSTFAPYYNQNQNQQPTKTTIQPLFSSLINRSELDTNVPVVPEHYSISKVVPTNKDSVRNISTLDGLSAVNTKIPTPLDSQSTEILSDFFHPIWYTLPVPTWLNYTSHVAKPPSSLTSQHTSFKVHAPSASNQASGSNENPKLSILQNRGSNSDNTSTTVTYVSTTGDSFRSFAPQVDSKDTIISDEFKGKIWLSHIGYEQIQLIKEKFLNSKKEDDIDEDEEDDEEDEDDEDEEPEDSVEDIEVDVDEDGEQVKVVPETIEEVESESVPKQINIANLINWDPERQAEFDSIKKAKEDIIKSPKALQRIISTTLLRLNKLRQERYFSSDNRNVLAPSNEEIRLYNKAIKLISLGVQIYKLKPQDLTSKLSFSSKIPVLISEYNGVLPGVPPTRLGTGTISNVSKSSSSNRLPNLRTNTYKKKRY